MPNEKKFEAKFTVKDEASQKINSFRQNIKALNTETKYQLKPLLDLRQSWMKVGLVWGFVAAGTSKLVSELAQMRKEITNVDELAIKLGTSSGEVSKKMYGFNIATDTARIGAGQLTTGLENLSRAWTWVKTKANEAIGSIAIGNRAQELAAKAGVPEYYEQFETIAKRQLWDEQRKRLGFSPEALNALAEVKNKTRALNMPQEKYKQFQFEQEVNLYRSTGINESALAKYTSAYNQSMGREFNKEHNKILAERYKAESNTLAAIKLEQQIALDDFTRKWGANGAMVREFKAGQKAVLDNAKLTSLGIKNNSQIWQEGLKDIVSGMQSTWSTFFSDSFNGELQKGTDYFRMFGQAIIQAWSKMLAEMVTKYIVAQAQMASSGGWINILGKVAGIIGGVSGFSSNVLTPGSYNIGGQQLQNTAHIGGIGGTYIGHRGGSVPYGLVRAHSGLAVNEIPLIAKRGEYVLSEQGVATAGGVSSLNRLNRGESPGSNITLQPTIIIQAVDTQSGTEFLLKHKKEIGQALLKELLSNDPALRGGLSRYGRK